MTSGQAVRFVVFAAPRTGSNLLCSLLNAHPDILCHRGLFNPDGIHWARGPVWAGGIGERDDDAATFLEAVWASGEDARAIGFKMNRGENPEAADLLLRDPSVRKILLRRRNRVRTYVSEEIARLTGVWESFEEPPNAPIPAIRVEPEELIRHIDLNGAYYSALETTLMATGQGWLDTDYEMLADGNELVRMLSYLGVEARGELAAACRKRGPSDLGAMVKNLNELADALRGTALLDDLSGRDVADLHSHHLAS